MLDCWDRPGVQAPLEVTFTDLGGDHYDTLNPDRARNNAVRKLHDLGYEVTLTPAAA